MYAVPLTQVHPDNSLSHATDGTSLKELGVAGVVMGERGDGGGGREGAGSSAVLTVAGHSAIPSSLPTAIQSRALANLSLECTALHCANAAKKPAVHATCHSRTTPSSLKPRESSYRCAPAPRPPHHTRCSTIPPPTTRFLFCFAHAHSTVLLLPAGRRPRHRPAHRHAPLRLLRPPRRRLHRVHRAVPPGVQARPAHEDVPQAGGGRTCGGNGGNTPGARTVAPGGA